MSVQKCECGNVLLDEEEQTNEFCAACVKRFEAMTAQSEPQDTFGKPIETPQSPEQWNEKAEGTPFTGMGEQLHEMVTALETPSELDVHTKKIHAVLVEIGNMYPADSSDIRWALQEIKRLMIDVRIEQMTEDMSLPNSSIAINRKELQATLTNTESKEGGGK